MTAKFISQNYYQQLLSCLNVILQIKSEETFTFACTPAEKSVEQKGRDALGIFKDAINISAKMLVTVRPALMDVHSGGSLTPKKLHHKFAA